MTASQESSADLIQFDDGTLRALVEGVLFISGDKPVMEWQLAKGLHQDRERIAGALAALAREYEGPERAVKIQRVAGSYRLTIKPEHNDRVKRLLQTPRTRTEFSPAALEALALIVLKQPTALEQINALRGVDSEGVIKTLLKRKLINKTSDRDWKGKLVKPVLYRTTRQFLVQFGLNGIDGLTSSKAFARVFSWRTENGAVEGERRHVTGHDGS